MSMKKWTDDELTSTRDKLDAWNLDHKNKGWAPRFWVMTALLGAFAISTGVVFTFLDGMDALSLILIVLGSVTCFSWYKSEKKKKENIIFLAEVKEEIARRARREEKSETGKTKDKKGMSKQTAEKKTTEKKDVESDQLQEKSESKEKIAE